jgi:hypothetical protein
MNVFLTTLFYFGFLTEVDVALSTNRLFVIGKSAEV